MLKGSRCYQQEIQAISAPDVAGGTRELVENNDCLVTAERLVSEGYNPLLLIFASGGHPGGGVENGARAQEETICRRSTLPRSIYAFHNPPAEVARLFHEVMEEEELKNKFKVITFSIIEDHNSGNSNLRPFQAEFEY